MGMRAGAVLRDMDCMGEGEYFKMNREDVTFTIKGKLSLGKRDWNAYAQRKLQSLCGRCMFEYELYRNSLLVCSKRKIPRKVKKVGPIKAKPKSPKPKARRKSSTYI